MSSSPTTIPVMRHGLTAMLGSLEGIEVVAQAADGKQAVREAVLHRPDVVLLDLQMPGTDGFEALRELSRALPGTAVCVLTMFSDDDSLFAAMRAGARGYLLKGAEQEDIERAVRGVAAGEAVFGPGVATRVLAQLTSAARRQTPSPSSRRGSRRSSTCSRPAGPRATWRARSALRRRPSATWSPTS